MLCTYTGGGSVISLSKLVWYSSSSVGATYGARSANIDTIPAGQVDVIFILTIRFGRVLQRYVCLSMHRRSPQSITGHPDIFSGDDSIADIIEDI